MDTKKDFLEKFSNHKDEIIEKTLALLPEALSGVKANRTFFVRIDDNGQIAVDYHYHAGLIADDNSCFLTIKDHETPDPELYWCSSIEEMDFEVCGFRCLIETAIEEHILTLKK